MSIIARSPVESLQKAKGKQDVDSGPLDDDAPLQLRIMPIKLVLNATVQ